MKKLISIIILLAVLISGCSKDSEDDDECNDPVGCDGQNPIVAINHHFGKAEKGPYLKDTEIKATPYDATWNQTGFPIEGYTEENDGSYQIHGNVSSAYVRTEIDGESYNEVDDRYDNVRLRDMSVNDSSGKNLNPLTTVQDMVASNYCRDFSHQYFEQTEYCLALAKSKVLSFLGFADYGTDFNQMSLQGNTLSDAEMAVFSFHVAGGRSGPEQNDYMRTVANGILNNNLVLKQSIQDDFNSMLFVNTRENLQNKYTELGLGALFPPVEKLPFVPDYYDDIWNNSHTVLESYSLSATLSINIDASYKYFAYPTQITSSEVEKYYASELEGLTSIRSTKVCGAYLCPDQVVVALTEMREVLLEDPVKLSHNYVISGDIEPGMYFLYQEFEGKPSHASNGDMVQFGYNLASNNGVDWIGGGNPTSWFVRESRGYTVK